jgi:hypothetical protein
VTDRTGLERCWEELAAARLLAGKGFEAQAVYRAYFAAFFAAEAALLALGETPSKWSARWRRGSHNVDEPRPPGVRTRRPLVAGQQLDL